jgi:hypothetical protein
MGEWRLVRAAARGSRRIGLRRNPFRRPVDRIETVARILAVVASVFGILLALGVAGTVHRHDLRESAGAGSRQVVAVVSTDVPSTVGYGNVAVTTPVTATWHTPDGLSHTGLVQVLPPERAGSRVPIWIDRNGLVTDPPLDASDERLRQAAAAAVTLVIVLALVAGLLYAAHRRLDTVRHAAWARGWRQVGPLWTERVD